MTMKYTWKVTGLKTQDIGEKKGTIVQTHWEKTGTDEDGNIGTYMGATPFTPDPTDDAGPFVPFENLTEVDVIAWIESVVVGNYEDHVNGKIQEEINNKKSPIVVATLPWAPVVKETVTATEKIKIA